MSTLPSQPGQEARIVAFCGQAGAGKTTAALALVQTCRDFHRLSFADPIRLMLLALGLDSGDLSVRKSSEIPLLCGKTPRQAMQTLGTEWGRNLIGPDIWLNALRPRLNQVLDMGERAVFDDVRFDNEARFIRECGGVLIHLSRPGLPAQMAHASEAGVAEEYITHRINAASVDDLRSQLLAYLNDRALAA